MQITNVNKNCPPGTILILKGQPNKTINIKDCYTINKNNVKVKVSLYLWENNVKNYIFKGLSIPQDVRFDLPLGILNLQYKQFLVIENESNYNIDMFCNYVVQDRIFDLNNIFFVDQNGDSVSSITWNKTDYAESSRKKVIKFSENDSYKILEDTVYEINDNKLIVYKNTNEFIFPLNFIEYEDRYEINLIQVNYEAPFNFDEFTHLKTTTNLSNNFTPLFRISTTLDFTNSLWYEPDIEHNFEVDVYYIEYNNITGYVTPNVYEIDMLKNNLYAINTTFIPDTCTLSATVSGSSNWRLIDFEGTTTELFTSDVEEQKTSGTYTIELVEDDEVYSTYLIELQPNTENIFDPEDNDAKISVEFNSDVQTLDPMWRISESEDFTDISWNSQETQLSVTIASSGDYYIEFSSIDNFVTPATQTIRLIPNIATVYKFNYISSYGTFSVQKADLIDELDATQIYWRLKRTSTQQYTEWYNINSTLSIEYGDFEIEIREVEGLLSSIIDYVNIIQNQTTIYKINNTALL